MTALGGTELLMNRLKEAIDPVLLENFQIIPTRLTEPLRDDKVRIAYIHDLADDPQVAYLDKGGWKKFHLIVFVSNWQMQSFITKFKIPWTKCVVIENSILPIEDVDFNKPKDTIRLIYTPTPHRGLNILLPAFMELQKQFPNLQLDVFSSFELYGWKERDKEYENLFQICRDHPNINYHGSQPNEVVREALKNSHIFVYPSIWTETSCLCLIEAMSAGLICVHSNLGALFETAANLTFQYQYQDDPRNHLTAFLEVARMAISELQNDNPNLIMRAKTQKMYTDQIHNWNFRKLQWQNLLGSMANLPREFEKEDIVFDYRT